MGADWFHRHPHLTTALASVFVTFVIGVVAGGSGAPLVLGLALAAGALAAVAELASVVAGFPVVPRMLTGRDGLGRGSYDGGEWDLVEFSDAGGGGGSGDGG
jgi:hypothetical protein